MTRGPHASGTPWRSLWAGFLLGLAGAGVAASLIVAVALAGSWPIMLVLAVGFGDPGLLLLFGGLLVVALAAAAAGVWALRRWVLPQSFGQPLGALGWSATLPGMVAGAALVLLLMPASVKDTAIWLATGETAANRAPLPATEAERQHLRETVRPAAQAGDPAAQVELALALQRGAAGEARDPAAAADWLARAASDAQGHEARLLLALDARAEQVPRGGRLVTEADTALRIDGLRRVAGLPAAWQPALLGAIGELQRTHYGEHADDQPMRDTIAAAGRAGSRAFTVLAAQLDEAMALRDEKDGRAEQADAGFRRALQGYASAGAVFELARLRDEALPERLQVSPDSQVVPGPAPDAAVAQRLWRFAWALDADAVHERTTPGQRELAAAVALLAMERAPDPAQIASRNPAQRWAADRRALARWLLALRHARGDCLAALALSDATRGRGTRPRASSVELAWALAWAEAGERCASTDDERRQARELRGSVESLVFDPGELDAARDGAAATIAALR